MKDKYLKGLLITLLVIGCARTISDLVLKVGTGTDVDVKIEAELGKGASNPYLNYDATNDKWQFCNEGVGCDDMGSGGLPLLAKGSLLTSNGTANGEFSACANGEIIEWDSTEANGFKCVTKPTGSTGKQLVSRLIDVSWTTSAGNVASHTPASFSSVALQAGDLIKLGFEGGNVTIPYSGSEEALCTLWAVFSGATFTSHIRIVLDDPDNVNDETHYNGLSLAAYAAGTRYVSMEGRVYSATVTTADTYDVSIQFAGFNGDQFNFPYSLCDTHLEIWR